MPNSILLVDDDDMLRSLMSLLLNREGYTVYQAASGEQAMEFLETTVPDMFLLDVMMPGMTGFELCKHLRATPETAQRPIFLLSARSDKDSKLEGIASGANLYLVKPLEPDKLFSYIEEYLNVEVLQQ